MSSFAAFCKRKDIEISVQRYLIDALGAMAQGLFASLLMGTILSPLASRLESTYWCRWVISLKAPLVPPWLYPSGLR